MIENGIEVLKSAFEKFVGDGKYLVLYLIALIISVIYIKDKTNKSLLVNYTLIIILTVLSLVLLVPYVSHYYLLENNVQRMYKQYDKMIEILDKI